jgi:hypothetical protein
MRTELSVVPLTVLLCLAAHAAHEIPQTMQPVIVDGTIRSLIERHGEGQSSRVRVGVSQVAQSWWPEDGDAEAFMSFCTESFIADDRELQAVFERTQDVLEQVDGHLLEVQREILTPLQLDTGTVRPVDRLFSTVDLATHVDEDLYRSKVAFLLLLNFPVDTLSDRLQHGAGWDRRRWAESRMMDRFAQRVPASVSQEISRTFTEADQYIAEYNIRMGRLIDADGATLFPEDLRLITHWGLRDELKSQYAEGERGLARQRTILEVMKRIVRQEIPQGVIDNAELLWAPAANEVWALADGQLLRGEKVTLPREPDTRYARLLDVFRAVRAADPYVPTAPTFIDRRFELDRQIPEKDVEALFVSILTSTEFRDTAKLIGKRLGRALEPFDIWYNGFEARGAFSEDELNRVVAERYPDVAAFQNDLPRILAELGFSPEKAQWLARHIVVDPSRGAGHALGALRREDQAHLRTRVGENGMDFKGYNIAVHELGHNVEQVFSLNAMDYWWLNGVPNNGFTEALAFVFQNRDVELLGLGSQREETAKLAALSSLWGAAEIGGVALVDMGVWRWMYEHPEATPAELRQATLGVAREVWNRYFAPVFGVRDSEILAIYSHMIVYGLYLPDYPLGEIIAFQVADKLRQGDFGTEFERVSRQGRLTPDAWMRGAVGSPISTRALLDAARKALRSADVTN